MKNFGIILALLSIHVTHSMREEPSERQQQLLSIVNQVRHEFDQWNNRTESLNLNNTAVITTITDDLLTNNTTNSRGLLFLFALDRTTARQYLATLCNFLQTPQNNVPEINTILVRLEEVVHTTNNSLDNYFEQVRNAPQDLNYLWPLMQTHLNTQQTFLTRLNELCAQINQLGQ